MPFPNFHAARVKSPDAFQNIVVLKTLPDGVMIYGGKLKGETSSTAQAYRFPKSKFSAEQAKSWLKSHDIKVTLFEKAEKSDQDDLLRFDRAVLRGKAEDTPEGYVRADAVVTRTGVLLYRNNDGSIRRELRHPDHVFEAASLDSMKMIPITNGHPATKIVNADTAKELQIGNTGENIRPDGKFVMASLVITDGQSVDDVKKGKSELSLGYYSDLVKEDGIYGGQKYDHVQTNIRYNHLAIVDRARAGAMAALNLDENEFFEIENDENDLSINDPNHNPKGGNMPKINIDGIEYDCPQEVINSHGKQAAKIVELDAAAVTQKTELDTLQAKNDEQTTKITELEKATADEAIQKAVKARVALIDGAKKVIIDEEEVKKFDSLTNADIKKAVIIKKHTDKEGKVNIDLEGKSDDYINARFDAIVEAAPVNDSSAHADNTRKIHDDNADHQDEAADQEKSQKKMVTDMQDAWKDKKEEKK
ncbi:MAG: DUF2213 domain-containing protein [Nanoarchaeota archaeon]|nr:DUF2213 domain-containing protein [Nanoarchaeota archaeon]